MRDWRDIPVIINSFDRLACLERLLAWLRAHGTRRIVIIDNNSSYPPLLEAYARIASEGAQVMRLGENAGSRALWERDLQRGLGIVSDYIYTDSDVVPAPSCPADAIGHLQRVLDAYPRIKKVGLGLRLDNLPRHYRHRDTALLWEGQFWRRPARPGLMFAPVDTTFALYRASGGHDLEPDNLRTTWPYVADHLGWHSDSANPDDEERYYLRTARRDVTSWTGDRLRPDFAAGLPSVRTPRLMQLQDGRDAWPGWVQGGPQALSQAEAGSFDGFHLDHGRATLPTMARLHDLAKPNARLLLWCARPSWNPREILRFGAPAHEGSAEAYTGDWAISALRRFPCGAWLAHLFAVKPVRARVGSLEVWHEPVAVTDGLSPEPAFDVV